MDAGTKYELLHRVAMNEAKRSHNGLWYGEFDLVCRDRFGNIKWEELAKNSLTYQGSQYVLQMAFDSTSTRIANGSWYYALYTTTPTAAGTGAAAATNELGSAGYARGAATGAATFDTNPSYYRATFSQYTFSPGANDWANSTGIALLGGGTANTAGQSATWMLCYAAFSVARDLAPNDTLAVQYRLTLSSP